MSENIENLKSVLKIRILANIYHPNNPLRELFKEIRLRSRQALYILRFFGKVQKFDKSTFFYSRNCCKFQQFSRKEYKRAKAPIGLMLHMHLPVTQSFKTG